MKNASHLAFLLEGIYWGIENHVDIINMSFGTEVNSEALHSAVKAAADAGILLVAAAGNNAGKGILYPAAYPEVIAVGATTSDGTVLSGTAAGNELELLAPGSQIISTGMVDGYTTGSGTSLATAEVTGIASLLLAQSGATADMVRGLLRATAKEIVGSNAGLVDYGYAQEHFAEYLAAYQNGEVDETVFENPAVPETYDTEGMVNGLWDTDAHAWLVGKANESLSLNSTYVTIMSYTAKLADTDYHNSDSYRGLHGLGNYAANLYATWKFANYTKRGETPGNAKKYALADLVGATGNEGITTATDGPPAGLMDACVKLVGSNLSGKISGYSGTAAQKKYLVAGFTCHMIGDTYAHRTLVPAYVFKDVESGRKESASSTSYASRLGTSDFTNWSGLVEDYNKEKKDLIAFIHLEDYTTNKYKFNEKYEDNTEFCRERLNAALKCTREFLGQISAANNTASVDIIQQQTNVNLIKYSSYMGYFY